MTDTYSTPNDLGELKASELQGSLGERIGAQAGEAFGSGMRTFTRLREFGQAESGDETLGSQIGRLQNGEDLNDLVDRPAAPVDVPIADAKARIKQQGLETQLTLPDQPTIRQGVLDLMLQHAQERRDYDAAVSRGPQGFLPGALGMVTEIGAGMIDPINMAAFSIPVLGEARWGQMLASAGESLTKRAGVKALQGGLQGAAGSAALIPGDWWLHTKDGQDYTMADALKSVVMGAGMGATFHAGFGGIGDLRVRARGVPLPGSPEDLVLRGLMHGTHVPGAALESEGFSGEEIPGIAASAPRSAEMLAEVPGLGTGAQRGVNGEIPHRELEERPPAEPEKPYVASLQSGDEWGVGDSRLRGSPGFLVATARDQAHAEELSKRFNEEGGPGENNESKVTGAVKLVESSDVAGLWGHDPEFSAMRGFEIRDEAGAQVGEVLVDNSDPKTLRLEWVGSGGQRQALGPTRVRSLLRQARELFPEAERIEGNRASGARHGGALPEETGGGESISIALPPHPAEILADLPPAAREDAYRATAADVIAGRPARTAEMLQEAAKEDPRIAESLGGQPLRLIEAPEGGVYGPEQIKSGEKYFKAVDQDGNVAAEMLVKIDGKTASVEDILNPAAPRTAGRGTVGTVQMRSLLRQFREQHPEVEQITGRRVSGARSSGGYDLQAGNRIEVSLPDGRETAPEGGSGAGEGGNIAHVRARKASGPAARPEATRSLFEHIAANGGLRSDDPMIPDVKSSLGRDNHFVPGFGNLIRKPGQVSSAAARSGARAPMSLDTARESAVEAGYLEDQGAHTAGQSTSTVRHLLDAIDAEARGNRVYRNGAEPPKSARDEAQHEHDLNNHIDKTLGDYGVDLDRIPSKTRDRTLEIMDREGVTDPLDAYERAVMEETEHGAQAGEHERIPEAIPGWDVDHDAGAAPGAGGAAPPSGERGAGDAARDAGEGDRAAGRPAATSARGVADFQKFADGKRAVDDPDDVAASKAAEATPEPASIEPTKAVSAAEAAAKEADQLVADILPTLSEKERKVFEDALRELKDDKEARDQVVRDGAACLAAAVA